MNLAWPRGAVYDPAGGHWYLQWFTVLFLGATVALGSGYRLWCRVRPVPASGPSEAAAESQTQLSVG